MHIDLYDGCKTVVVVVVLVYILYVMFLNI